jgi:hypothetical protein
MYSSQCAQIQYEYAQDIINHMMVMQQITSCDPNMMELQPELEWHMRPYLLDFLVESHVGLELSPQTLFLAVNIIDRYSSRRIIYKRHYQLVGCTALWIASKYQDKKDRIPTLQELKMLCCGAYESHMFVQMESHILNTLEWTIGHPTCDLYIDLFVHNLGSSSDSCYLNNLALYICELAMFHKSLLVYSSATIASSAVALAQTIWHYVHYKQQMPVMITSNMDSHHLRCFELLQNSLLVPSLCLQRKYSRSRFGQVFILVAEYVQRPADEIPSSPVSMAPQSPAPSTSYTYDSTPPYKLQQQTREPANPYYYDQKTHRVPGYMTPPFSPDDYEAAYLEV